MELLHCLEGRHAATASMGPTSPLRLLRTGQPTPQVGVISLPHRKLRDRDPSIGPTLFRSEWADHVAAEEATRNNLQRGRPYSGRNGRARRGAGRGVRARFNGADLTKAGIAGTSPRADRTDVRASTRPTFFRSEWLRGQEEVVNSVLASMGPTLFRSEGSSWARG